MYWPTLVSKFGEGSFTMGSIIQSTIAHFSTDFDYKGEDISKKYDSIPFQNYVFRIFVSNIEFRYAKIRYLFSAVQMFFRGKRKEVGSGLRNLDQGIEQILINIQWKKSNEKTIYDWIRSKIRGPVDNALSISPLISK